MDVPRELRDFLGSGSRDTAPSTATGRSSRRPRAERTEAPRPKRQRKAGAKKKMKRDDDDNAETEPPQTTAESEPPPARRSEVTMSSLGGLGGLPLPLLRNEHGKLDASRLRPSEAWPGRVAGPSFDQPLYIGTVVYTNVSPGADSVDDDSDSEMLDETNERYRARFIHASHYWSPPSSSMWGGTAHSRVLTIEEKGRTVATVRAQMNDDELFWHLFQLEACTSKTKGTGAPVTMTNVNYDAAKEIVRVDLGLEPKKGDVFEFDHIFEQQDETMYTREMYEDACNGDIRGKGSVRGTSTGRQKLRSLRRLLHTLATSESTSFYVENGLEFGIDTDAATLNNFLLGPRSRAEIFGGDDDDDPDGEKAISRIFREHQFDDAEENYSVSTLLKGATIDDDGSPVVDGLTPEATAKLKTTLHPFQERGVAWMRARERAVDSLTLHPSWTQYKLPGGDKFIYAHRYMPAFSRHFFPAPAAKTCGGLLCDDVGLGKSVQVLGLVLSAPPDPGWAVDELPLYVTDNVPIKTTLIVCPAAILDQWEQELEKHVVPNGLVYSVYLGIGHHQRGQQAPVSSSSSTTAASSGVRSRPRRRCTGATTDETKEEERGGIEVLAKTRSHLFRAPRSSTGPAAPLAQCDVLLCSFETLRDEVRKTGAVVEGSNEARLATPLGALGFYRIVLDEAQLVSQTTSVAALMCSSLARRYAWVCTATPVNRDVRELHGLVAFLGVDPIAEKYVCDQLVLEPFKDREPGSRARILALCRGLMLRRGQRRPGIARQIALPPLTWDTVLLKASPAERAAYRVAETALKRSYANHARHVAATNRRGGGHLLGVLNGDLTRLRQVICHPAVVNQNRDTAQRGHNVLGNGEILPLSVVLRRIVARAERDALAAMLSVLRAKLLYIVTRDSTDEDDIEDDGETFATVCLQFESLQESMVVSSTSNNKSDDEEDHKQKCGEALERFANEIAVFRERHPDDTMNYATEIQWSPNGGATLAAYRQPDNDSDDDDDDPGRSRRRGATTRDKLAERVVRLVARVGAGKAPADAKKQVATAAAACRDKEASRNYVLQELREAEKLTTTVSENNNKEGEKNQDDDDDDDEDGTTCRICMETRGEDTRWSVTVCGHGCCAECMEKWVGTHHNCPLCKRSLTREMVYTVASLQEETEETQQTGDLASHLEFGTKLCAFLKEAGAAVRNGEKIVVFSAWTRLLNLAGAACGAHNVAFASLIGSPAKKQAALADFAGDGCTVLLVPLFGGASGAGGGGAAGLTLTHASTAIILEPALQPGVEQQAAGRISRIGQTKPARVVRLIVEDTVEPKILSWQEHRLNDSRLRTSGGNALTLNDFVQLGVVGDS